MRITKMGYTQLLLIAVLIRNVACQNYTGDPCVYANQATNGICRSITDCPTAITDLSSRILPQICGFLGNTSIVCCPIKLGTDEIVPTPGAKSLQKCKEYAKMVYPTVPSPVLILNETTETLSACDHKPVELIVGGQIAEAKDFPHVVTLGYDNPEGKKIYAVEGSLISENFVLTAARLLVLPKYGEVKYVRIGDQDLVNNDPAFQEFIVVDRIPHPDWLPPSVYNDLALLKLDKNIKFSAYVRPICLNYATTLRDEKAIATAWIRLLPRKNLLKVTLDLHPKDCNKAFLVTESLARGIDDNTQICAGLIAPSNLYVAGEEGGPLQVYSTDQETFCMYKLLGVTSFGIPLGYWRYGVKLVYTKVSNYLPWIESIVWP